MKTRQVPLWACTLSLALAGFLATIAAPFSAGASAVVVPHLFTNGQVADADSINANFDVLATAINGHDTRIATLENAGSGGGLAFKRAVLVSPSSTAVASGDALRSALAGITDASASKPYALLIEPGIYDLGTQELTLKDYVDLVGFGPEATVIQGTGGSGSVDATDAVLVASSQSQLRDLAIRATGAATCVALYVNAGETLCENVSATASGTTDSYAIHATGATLKIVGSHAQSQGTGLSSTAILATSCTLSLQGSTLAVAGAATENRALWAVSGKATLSGTALQADGGTSKTFGLHSQGATLISTGLQVSMTPTASENWGLRLASSSAFDIVGSQIAIDGASSAGLVTFYGVEVSGSSGRLTGGSIATKNNGGSIGIYTTGNAAVSYEGVALNLATTSTSNTGISNASNVAVTYKDMDVEVKSGTGIFESGGAGGNYDNVRVLVSPTSTGPHTALSKFNSATTVLAQCHLEVKGGTEARAVYILSTGSDLVMRHCFLSASQATSSNRAIHVSSGIDSIDIDLHACQLQASTAISNESAAVIRMALCQIAGSVSGTHGSGSKSHSCYSSSFDALSFP